MIVDIEKYDITERKSNSLNINTTLIPSDLERHFYRGMFDGDGSLSCTIWKNKPNINVSLTSSSVMIEKAKSDFEKRFVGFKSYIYNRHPANPNNTTLLVRNHENIKQLVSWLYKEAQIYQNVKYQKYQDITNLLT